MENANRVRGWPKLRSYQKPGAVSLAEREVKGLWWSTGTGKTSVLLVAWALAGYPMPLIIITKAIGRNVFPRDAAWALGPDYVPAILTGGQQKLNGRHESFGRRTFTSLDLALSEAPAIVTNYEILRERNDELARIPWKAVIFDEVHEVKGGYKPPKKRDGTLHYFRYHFCKGLSSIALSQNGFVCSATATPIVDRRRDLFAQLDIVSPGTFGNAWSFLHRYCITPDTSILCADGRYREAQDIKIGDLVLGWEKSGKGYRGICPTEVTWTDVRIADRYLVELSDGTSVKCTGDHHWFTGRSEPENEYRPLLPGKTSYRPLKKIIRVFCPPEDSPDEGNTDYMAGYMCGLVEGDGNVSRQEATPGKRGPSHRVVVAQKDISPLDRLARYGTIFGFNPKRRVRNCDGYDEVGFYTKSAYLFFKEDHKGTSDEFMRGWLSGMMDAEGCAHNNLICQKASETTISLIDYNLKRAGFGTSRWGEGVAFDGGVIGFVNYWIKTQPAMQRKFDVRIRTHRAGVVGEKVKIKSVTPLGPGPVISIETKSGNYFANGLASKNCDAHPGKYGGLETSGTSNTEELMARLRGMFSIVTRADVIDDLPPVTYDNYLVSFDGDMMTHMGGSVETALIRAGEMKKKAVLSKVAECLTSKLKVAVVATRRKLAYSYSMAITGSKFAKKLPRHIRETYLSECVTGAVEPIERAHKVEKFNMKPTGPACLVATMGSIMTSIDLQQTDIVIIASFPVRPGDLYQFLGRFNRIGGRPVTIIFMFAERTIDERYKELVIDKALDVAQMGADTQGDGGALDALQDKEFEEGILSGLRDFLSGDES